jgi:hypothetical protein
MPIGIVQLSDIHIKGRDNPVCGRLSHIRNAVQGVAHDISDLLLVVTGDVAYSGKPEEYTLAAAFLAGVEGGLRGIPCVNFLGTVLIPGNHDCDFGNQGSVRTMLINSTASAASAGGNPPEDFVCQMLEVQKAFFEFESSVSGREALTDRLSWTRKFQATSGSITVRCLNTAWLSQREELRRLYFPVSLVSETSSDTDLALTLLHHPYNWLEPDNARALRKALETTSDLLLTGH